MPRFADDLKEYIKMMCEGEELRDLFERNQRRVEYIKRMLEWKRSNNAIFFKCETNEGKEVGIRLDLCAEDVFRLRVAISSKIPAGKTPMLVKEKLSDVKFQLEEKQDFLLIRIPRLSIKIDKNPWKLSVYDDNGKIICRETSSKNVAQKFVTYPLGFSTKTGSDIKYTFETISLAPDEHLYGLGEKFLNLDKRGQRITSWTTDALGNSTDRTYKNIPFFMSTEGYGIFINSSYEIIYDMGKQSQLSYTFLIKDGLMDYFFIYGPSFKKILNLYTELTGKAPLPPKWSFGLWMSKCIYRNRSELEGVCRKLREHEIPCDVMNLDPAWLKEGHRCDFEWNEETFPNPKEMIAKLNEAGFKLSLWIWPYVSKETEMFKEGQRCGFFAKKREKSIRGESLKGWNRLFENWGIVDFSNPKAVRWFKRKLQKVLELGVAVIKSDYGEAAPRDAIYYGGMSGEEMHNLYPLLYNKTVFEAVKGFWGKGIVWGRSGYAGMQRYPICWSGDPAADFHTMACVLRGGLSLGFSGVPFWSHDIGGFYGKPTPELYIRWAQFGLFCSHSRCHGRTSREPWAFGDEALCIFRRYVKLRYRLLSYIYSCAHISCQTGVPIIRAMVLEYQDDLNCYDKDLQYMFGESFLVAPIFNESGIRNIYLPKGKWIDYWTKEEFGGPMNLTYRAPLDTLPLFVKGDSIIPMGPEISYVGEKPFDPITLDIYCYSDAKFKLHDDGETTIFKCFRDPDKIVLEISKSRRNYVLIFNKVHSAKKVTINGEALARYDTPEEFKKAREGWWLDFSGKVMVKIATEGETTVTLKME